MRGLTELDLSDNEVRDDGAKDIANKLENRSELRALWVIGNEISQEVMDDIRQHYTRVKIDEEE